MSRSSDIDGETANCNGPVRPTASITFDIELLISPPENMGERSGRMFESTSHGPISRQRSSRKLIRPDKCVDSASQMDFSTWIVPTGFVKKQNLSTSISMEDRSRSLSGIDAQLVVRLGCSPSNRIDSLRFAIKADGGWASYWILPERFRFAARIIFLAR